jgi:acyl-coenzyme A synthetase/AMP-(fatty) acid ligase
MFDFKYLNNTAVFTGQGEIISYRTLNKLSGALAKYIKPRSLIFNLCSNNPAALTGYVCALQNNHVSLMLSDALGTAQLNELIKLYSPNYLYLPETRKNDFTYNEVYSNGGYVLLEIPNSKTVLHNDLALLLTTSGSTGSPKLVRQSRKNIKANADAIIKCLEITPNERAITSLPMNYTYGLSVINSHLEAGAGIILTNATIMQKNFWSLMSDYEATSIAGVPYTYEMLDKLRFMRRELPNLKTMTQAGGKLSPNLHEKFARYAQDNNKKFVVMYGQTEATARMGYLPTSMSLAKIGSMGIAIPGGKFLLIDVDGKEITTPDAAGELVYLGDNVALGYAETAEDLAKGSEFNGKLLTGDIAHFDEDGYFYITGRKKRFLKIYGNRVSLDETECLIKSKFTNLDCACTGTDDAMTIFITAAAYLKEVQNFIAAVSKINFSAFKVKYIEKIPKNESGKILYKELGV